MTEIDVAAYANLVAGELGKGWVATPGAWANRKDAFLIGPDGARLHLGADGWRPQHQGRIAVWGTFPDGVTRRYNAPRHEITVGLTRPAKAAASAITRRLLPAYVEELREETARLRNRETQREEADILRGSLMRKLPKAWDRSGTVEFEDGSARVPEYGGPVTFEAQIPADRAEAFAVLLRDFLGA